MLCYKQNLYQGVTVYGLTMWALLAIASAVGRRDTLTALNFLSSQDSEDSVGLSLISLQGSVTPGSRANRSSMIPLRGGHSLEPESLLTSFVKLPGRIYNQIAVNVSYNGFVEEMYTFPERRPRIFNVGMATAKTWLADFIVQIGESHVAGRGWTFDWKRSTAFACFGFFYVGIVQWFLYVTIFTAICPNAISFANEPWADKMHDRTGQMDLVKQVCYDNFLLETMIYFPVFYVIREVVNGNGGGEGCGKEGKEGLQLPRRTFGHAVHAGVMKYAQNFKQDNLASWAVWVPADVVVYAVPMFMRMPLDHLVSFGWTMLLSHMRGNSHK